ncbi:uncharacterized protein LOC120216991 [Hibiscus syriacus]|uniref:uncharacterized protein LOC120216991 n=1 Tax=Hibiscus syriacus TaxID=106335 RepID=UPI0019220BB6|nr:uncharacterized protein LOC120216991 [Hibiscus syriacus]
MIDVRRHHLRRPKDERTGASELFMSEQIAKRLGLHMEKATGSIKTVNAEEVPILKGVRKEEPTFVASLVEIEPTMTEEVPTEVGQVLAEFRDVMPTELPKNLPSKREVDHKIELVPNAEPLAKTSYRMAPPELEELRRQLKELLDAGYIRPSKSPFGAPVLF